MNTDAQKVYSIVLSARQVPEAERDAYVAKACGDNTALKAEALSLLDHVKGGAISELKLSKILSEVGRATDDGSFDPGEITNYRIHTEKPLGVGGFGAVYLAEQLEPVRRTVAIKVIKEGINSGTALERFTHERQLLAQLEHPNIARLYDGGTTSLGFPFFSMELVSGVPIVAYCDAQRLTIRERLRLFVDVCSAVEYAHVRNIIHRDLKPSNVLVTQTDSGKPVPKVIDFGISKAIGKEATEKMTLAGDTGFAGTPEYMSPEQAEQSKLVDGRADVYSLGCLLVELLTGGHPFDVSGVGSVTGAERIAFWRRMLRDGTPRRLVDCIANTRANEAAEARGTDAAALKRVLRSDLEFIPQKALAKDPDTRYQRAASLARDVENYLNRFPLSAGPRTTGYRVKKFLVRRRAGVLAACLLLAAIAAGVTGTLIYAVRESERSDELERVAAFQASMLTQLDSQSVGNDLRRLLHEEMTRVNVPEAALDGLNTTNVAIGLLDEAILAGAEKAAQVQFADEPALQARLLQTIAQSLRSMARYERAHASQERALQLRRETLGDEHPDTLRSMNELGSLLLAQRRFDEAAVVVKEAFDTRRRTLGDLHPDTLESWSDMAYIAMKRREYAQAAEYYTYVLESRRRLLGDDHKETIRTVECMNTLLQEQQKLSEAEPYALAAVEGWKRIKPDSAEHLRSLNGLATLYFRQQKLEEAEKVFRDIVLSSRRVGGDRHSDTLSAISNHARTLNKLNRHNDAETLWREVVSGADPNTPIGANAADGMAVTLLGLKRPREAEEFAVRAASENTAYKLPPTFLARYMDTLANVYAALHASEPGQGYDVKESEWRERAKKLQPAPKP